MRDIKGGQGYKVALGGKTDGIHTIYSSVLIKLNLMVFFSPRNERRGVQKSKQCIV